MSRLIGTESHLATKKNPFQNKSLAVTTQRWPDTSNEVPEARLEVRVAIPPWWDVPEVAVEEEERCVDAPTNLSLGPDGGNDE